LPARADRPRRRRPGTRCASRATLPAHADRSADLGARGMAAGAHRLRPRRCGRRRTRPAGRRRPARRRRRQPRAARGDPLPAPAPAGRAGSGGGPAGDRRLEPGPGGAAPAAAALARAGRAGAGEAGTGRLLQTWQELQRALPEHRRLQRELQQLAAACGLAMDVPASAEGVAEPLSPDPATTAAEAAGPR
jgi:hypothetical protein